jgi:hypothetical protein
MAAHLAEGTRRRGGHRCRSKWRVVGTPPRFWVERFQFKEFRFERFRFEHADLSVAVRTLRPDVAVVAALADPGRAVLVPPRRPLLADATLPLLALTHLGDSLSRTPSTAWLLAPMTPCDLQASPAVFDGPPVNLIN